MREYSSEELDLMAEAYERVCEELSNVDNRSADIETTRSRLVDGIVEAMDRGERNVDDLVAASLSTVSDPKPAGLPQARDSFPGRSRPHRRNAWVSRPTGLPDGI